MAELSPMLEMLLRRNQPGVFGGIGTPPFVPDERDEIPRALGRAATGPISTTPTSAGAPASSSIPPPNTLLGRVGDFASGIGDRLNSSLESPLGRFSAQLLARSGPSLTPQSTLSNIGSAALGTQALGRQDRLDDLQRKFIESRIGLNRGRASGLEIFGKINPSDFTPESLQKFHESNNFSDLEIRDKQRADPAAVAEFEFFKNLSPESQKEFLSVKRANRFENLPGIGAGPVDQITGQITPTVPETTIRQGSADRASAEETAKLDARTKNKVRNELPAQIAKDEAFINKAEEFIGALEDGTLDTGPFIGRFPAVTTKAQLFEAFSGENTLALISEATFGALSEGEREFLVGTTIGRGKTEEANIKIMNDKIRMLRDAQRRNEQRLSESIDSNVIDFNDLPQ